MKSFSQKIITILLIVLIFSPGLVLAQNPPTPIPRATPVLRAIPVNENTLQPVQFNTNNQAGSSLGINQTNTGINYGAGVGSAAQGTASCFAAGGVANAAKKAIGGFVSGVVGSVTTATVPTNPVQLTDKEVGVFGGWGVSWDQVGFCLINSVISYIGQATVAWINGGFQGNPVFVDNPEQFFADIADIQAGMFLNELTNGLACTPFKDLVRINLATSYNSQIAPFGQQCSFSAIAGNLDQFTSGETFGWQDWISYTQIPQNNPFGATYVAQIELDRRIAQALGTQSNLLSWGRGFLSFTDPETKKITSPGSVIEGQINNRLFAGENRLNIADEFDEIVDALVNSLIKVALNEVVGGTQ